MEEDAKLAMALADQHSSGSDSDSADGPQSPANPARMAQLNELFASERDVAVERQAFSRDSFRKLISRTFDDYYPMEYNRAHFNLEEYMQLVQAEQLEAKYGVYLEINDENIVTLKNLPWLDIGDLPTSYSQVKREAFQVYMPPVTTAPTSMIIQHSEWKDAYDTAHLAKHYASMNF